MTKQAVDSQKEVLNKIERGDAEILKKVGELNAI